MDKIAFTLIKVICDIKITVLIPGRFKNRPKIGTLRRKFMATGKKPLQNKVQTIN